MSYLRPGLTAATASQVCMNECKAQCCKGPLILRLNNEEVLAMEARARCLGIDLAPTRTASGDGWLRFSDYPGECCPFLDGAASVCRIYDDRPRRCREFPEKPTPGCAISAGY